MKLTEARRLVEGVLGEADLQLRETPPNKPDEIVLVDGRPASVNYVGIEFRATDVVRLYKVFFIDNGRNKPMSASDHGASVLVGQRYEGEGGNRFTVRGTHGARIPGLFLDAENAVAPVLRFKDITEREEARRLTRALESQNYRDASFMAEGRIAFSPVVAAWLRKANPRTWEAVEDALGKKYPDKSYELYKILAREYGDNDERAPAWNVEKWVWITRTGGIVKAAIPSFKGLK